MSAPTRFTENDGVRASSPRRSTRVTSGDSAAMSRSSAIISPAGALSSVEATISIGSSNFSR